VDDDISKQAVALTPRLMASGGFEVLYREGMGLIEEVAAYLDGPGRADSKALSREASFVYATESMRLTTRLMQLASWLLLQRAVNEGEIITLFGAGGDRDAGKRPQMGKVAADLSDHVIVTDDNPRSEEPSAIRAAVLAGAPQAEEIGGRRDAIAAAIRQAGADDIVLLAGKGHEQGQIIGDRVLPFDDVTVARESAG